MRRLICNTMFTMSLCLGTACLPTKDESAVAVADASLNAAIASTSETPKWLAIPGLPPELRNLPPALVDVLLEACRDEETGEFDTLCVAAALSSDRDCDGFTFLEEIARGLDPASPLDGPDRDCDGLTNDEDPDIDGDGTPNEDDPDVDADLIPNDEDDDVDNDGVPNNFDFDVDGDFLLNRWDIDNDADGKPDPKDDEDEDEPEDCEEDDDADEGDASNDSGDDSDDESSADEGVPAAAASTVSRLRSLGAAGERAANRCDPPTAADKASAVRQGARALNRQIAISDLSEMLRELEQAAQAAAPNEDQPSEAALDALDALIAMIDQSIADADDPQQAVDQLQDRAEGVQVLAAAPGADAAADADAALKALTDMIDALADNDASLRIAEQAAVVAAVAEQQPDESLVESAADAVVLIAVIEEAGADPGPAADVYVPLAAATGALSDYDVLAAIVGSTLQVASDTGSPIRQTAKVIERLTFRLDDPDVDALAASAGSLLRAANDRGVNPFDVLEELDSSGVDLSDGVSEEEANRAADAVAAEQ
ncbi:MAG: hypothetical protein SF069_03925 [Phycisphaerae bacterium]|nr:hypothetical protein [Phycisphaerae bacterium]